MLKYIIKRIIMVVPVLLGVTMIIFFITRILAPDPAAVVLGEHATQEAMSTWRDVHGLNDPLYKQYIDFVLNACQGDLGVSYYSNQPVAQEIADRFPATIELAVYAIIVASIVGVSLGVVAAVRKNKLADHVSMLVALVGVSMP
ncbi:MAG: ABC transporter permease, partial [Coriobacteriia bacterium]|nr:ABC transporter permease [Coriobacteriia bacterium]